MSAHRATSFSKSPSSRRINCTYGCSRTRTGTSQQSRAISSARAKSCPLAFMGVLPRAVYACQDTSPHHALAVPYLARDSKTSPQPASFPASNAPNVSPSDFRTSPTPCLPYGRQPKSVLGSLPLPGRRAQKKRPAGRLSPHRAYGLRRTGRGPLRVAFAAARVPAAGAWPVRPGSPLARPRRSSRARRRQSSCLVQRPMHLITGRRRHAAVSAFGLPVPVVRPPSVDQPEPPSRRTTSSRPQTLRDSASGLRPRPSG